MAKRIKIGNAILCEYVAQGENRKHTLVNVYGGDIVTDRFPAQFPLGIFIEATTERHEQATTLNLEVLINKERRLTAEIKLAPGHPTGIIALQQFQFRFESESELEVFLTSPGYARTLAISRKIERGDVGNRR